MKLKIYSADGSASQEKDYPIVEFEGDKGLMALRQVLIAYQANRRLGTRKAKTVAQVAGSGKKPFRQKGTGMARQGTRRAPQMRGGGVAHAPQQQNWRQKINRKTRQLALRRAIYNRAVDGGIELIEAFAVEEPKTRLFNELMSKTVPGGKVLVVDDQWPTAAALAARNIERVAMTEAGDLNAWDLARYSRILISERGLETLLARAGGQS